MTYRPQRDITAYELSEILTIMIAFVANRSFETVPVADWWDGAGPEIWRHFKAEKRNDA